MRRRKLLQSIGTGAVAIGAVGNVSASSTANKSALDAIDNITVKDLEAEARDQIISQANSDSDFQAVKRRIQSKGWKLSWNDATVRRVFVEDQGSEQKAGKYDYIIISGERRWGHPSDANDEELILFWFGNETIDTNLDHHTFAHYVRETSNGPSVQAQEHTTDSSGLFGYDEGTAIIPENGTAEEKELELQSASFDTQGAAQRNQPESVKPQGHSDSGWCKMDIMIVEGMDWECFAKAIAGLVGTIIGCAGCAISLNPGACIACAIAAGLTYAQFKDCRESFTDGIHVVEEVDKDWFDQYKSTCSDYWVHNDDKAVMTQDYYHKKLPTR